MIDTRDIVSNVAYPGVWLMGIVVGRQWIGLPFWLMVVMTLAMIVWGFFADIYLKPIFLRWWSNKYSGLHR